MWLQKYKEGESNEKCSNCITHQDEIKRLKVMVGSVDQENFVLKQNISSLTEKIEKLEGFINELNENKVQYEDHVTTMMKQLDELERKNNIIEDAGKTFMEALGYDCSE